MTITSIKYSLIIELVIRLKTRLRYNFIKHNQSIVNNVYGSIT
jgi:hypothetical protein